MVGALGRVFAATGLCLSLALAPLPLSAQAPTPEHVGMPPPPSDSEITFVDAAKDARCRDGEAEACLELGLLYLDGRNALINLPLARELLHEACDLDSAEGCLRLASSYFRPGVTFARLDKSLELTDKACTLGLPEACFRLGETLESGRYHYADKEDLDPALGKRLFRRSCDDGYVEACEKLASFKLDPGHGDHDFATGIAELEALCAAGNPAVCTNTIATLEYFEIADAEVIAKFQVLACREGDARACMDRAGSLAREVEGEDTRAAITVLLERACRLDFDNCAIAVAHRREPALAAACDDGDLQACAELGRSTADGHALAGDHELAGRRLATACLQGLLDYCRNAAQFVLDSPRAEDPQQAADQRRILELACTDERPLDCLYLADDLLQKYRPEPDNPVPFEDRLRAAELYADACEAGSNFACVQARDFEGLAPSVAIESADDTFIPPLEEGQEQQLLARTAWTARGEVSQGLRSCQTSTVVFRGVLFTHEECEIAPAGPGGIALKPGQAPWQALLWRPARLGRTLSAQQRVFCGGTLIARGWILTAAHCLKEVGSKTIRKGYRVRLGVHNPRTPEGVSYPIVETISHPDFNSRNYAFDIALVRYDYRKPYQPGETNSIRTIALDSKPIASRTIRTGMTVYTYGWGWIEVDGYETSDELLSMKMQLRSLAECTRITAFTGPREDAALCAGGSKGEQACNGDSGGPLIYYGDADRVPKVIGVVSAGKKCGTLGEPSRYTRVAKVRGWIRQQMDRYPNWGF